MSLPPSSSSSSSSSFLLSSSAAQSFLLMLLFLSTTIHLTSKFADATCNAAQSSSCLQAAGSGQLDQLPSSGQCIVKQYLQYTHLCTVVNYMPTTDYCCCMFDERLLCCRYHQNWYHYRCMETEDELEMTVSDASYTSASLDMPLLTLLPVILCPLVAVAICVICWTKCWCYRYDNDSTSSSSSSSSSWEFYCCRCCKVSEGEKEKIPSERFDEDDDARAPLQQPSSSGSASSAHCGLRSLHPCCSSHPPPSHLPIVADGIPSVYQHSSTSSSPTIRLIEPSAPPISHPPPPPPPPPSPPPPRLPHPSASGDDLYSPCLRRTSFDNGNGGSQPTTCDSSLSDFLRMISSGDPSIVDAHHSICLRRIPGDHRSNTYDILPQQHVYCACAAFAVDRAQCRCNCDVGRALAVAKLAHAQHVPCANCLPPAYESINAESSAQL